MRVLIVDDEAAARRRLATLLEDLGVEIAGEASDGLTALGLSAERRPDVMLLDVSMPEVDGFDVARHLTEPRPLIIFQTAHAEHALRAFEHDALDYVVKPVTRERLAQALERANRRLSATRSSWTPDELQRLGSAICYAPARPARVLVRQGAGHRLVPARDIIRFCAADGLVYAHTALGHLATDYTLNELESRHGGMFLRVSRGDLVSLSHISAIAGNGDGSATLTLSDGTCVNVSRRRAAAVRAAVHHLF
jgi:DNA-binding LytR/AlgR family response regulator